MKIAPRERAITSAALAYTPPLLNEPNFDIKKAEWLLTYKYYTLA